MLIARIKHDATIKIVKLVGEKRLLEHPKVVREGKIYICEYTLPSQTERSPYYILFDHPYTMAVSTKLVDVVEVKDLPRWDTEIGRDDQGYCTRCHHGRGCRCHHPTDLSRLPNLQLALEQKRSELLSGIPNLNEKESAELKTLESILYPQKVTA